MNKIEKLINELCPNGVEYKKIGSFCKIQTGKGITNKDTKDDGTYPVVSGGIEPMGFYDLYNRSENTVTIARAGSAGYVSFMTTKFYLNDKCFSVIPNDDTNSKYLYYALKNIEVSIVKMKSTGSVPTVNTVKVSSIEIPVPPLPIQEEIVRILDNFTELTAELTAELQDRKKQYEYYRDSLLTFKNDIEFKRIGDIATISRGGSFQKSDFVESGKPAIHYGKIYTHYDTYTDKTINFVSEEIFNKSKKAQPNDIVMAVTSENVEDVCKCVAWLGNEEVAVSGHTAIIHHNQNPKYLSYYFHSSLFLKQKEKLAHGTKVIEVTPDRLNDVVIPVPPIDIQDRIVNVLDNFEKICNDLKIGLPAEIELRQKQYEYYRDLLLTFPENDLHLSKQASKQAKL